MSSREILRQLVLDARELLAGEGILTVSSRDLANGVRCEFRSGTAVCGINFYYSDRKGFSVVPSGGDSGLAERIREVLSHPVLPFSDPSGPAAAGSTTGTGSWIGSDEAGKGDYMGPLVVSAVWTDRELASKLRSMGVRDSKLLGREALSSLAGMVRQEIPSEHVTVVLMPQEYNLRLEEIRLSGGNSLDLLAECHARAIGKLFERMDRVDRVLIDRFCPERRIAHLLPEGGYVLELRERAESDPAVAAASILARDSYMAGLEAISGKYGIQAVPGSGSTTDDAAGRFVERFGPDVLRDVAKYHFGNTARIVKAAGSADR